MKNIIGPDGSVLTVDKLPAPETRRWVARRKAEVVAAVQGGMLSFGDACERYALTAEEFIAWQDAIELFGMRGLRATRPHVLATNSDNRELRYRRLKRSGFSYSGRVFRQIPMVRN